MTYLRVLLICRPRASSSTGSFFLSSLPLNSRVSLPTTFDQRTISEIDQRLTFSMS